MPAIQLNPPLPLMTTKGEGMAHFLIDYGIEHDLYWVVFINDSCECWTLSNRDIRACKNITLGRTNDSSYLISKKNIVGEIIEYTKASDIIDLQSK